MRQLQVHARSAALWPLETNAAHAVAPNHDPTNAVHPVFDPDNSGRDLSEKSGPDFSHAAPGDREDTPAPMRGATDRASVLRLASKDHDWENANSVRSDVLREKDLLKRWFLKDALPLWQRHGLDLHNGGFFEKLTGDLRPVEEERRARLVARQIYVYAIAHEMGWGGPSAEVIEYGLAFLTRNLLRGDGHVIASCRADGAMIQDAYDPYDYAFVLFGLAAAAKSLGRYAILPALAAKIRDRMIETWSHPIAGFQAGDPPKIPQTANSHMHLLEAFLAWEDLDLPDAGTWRQLADNIVDLCLDYLIDPLTGAIEEFYDLTWRPLPGDQGGLIEPGHQFEWAWLLLRWARRRRRPEILPQVFRLVQIGEEYGVDKNRGVAINALRDDFSIRDASAKLWPQTERIKAWCALAACARNAAEEAHALERLAAAIAGFQLYLARKPSGLWWETLQAEGDFVSEPARASSFYHIAGAVHALDSVSRDSIDLTP